MCEGVCAHFPSVNIIYIDCVLQSLDRPFTVIPLGQWFSTACVFPAGVNWLDLKTWTSVWEIATGIYLVKDKDAAKHRAVPQNKMLQVHCVCSAEVEELLSRYITAAFSLWHLDKKSNMEILKFWNFKKTRSFPKRMLSVK